MIVYRRVKWVAGLIPGNNFLRKKYDDVEEMSCRMTWAYNIY